MRVRGAAMGVALLVALSLAGCATEEPQAAPTTPPAEPSATPTPEPEVTEDPGVFAMPEDCRGMIPQSRIDTFEDDGLALLGGPGGVYGTDYFADPTPEEIAGGITCVWAIDGQDFSSIALSVAPLTDQSKPTVVQDLLGQGLNETIDGDVAVYEIIGDVATTPAIVNVVRDDSWISVLVASGGQSSYEEAREYADEIYETVYN